MWRTMLFAAGALCLGGCQYQIALGVEQMTGTIPVMLSDNVLDNLVRVNENPDAIIGQVALKQSVSTAANGLNYGASPNIAFRAIAFTGLTANVTNSLSYNWSVDPVNGSVDLRRLQMLFQYALGKNDTPAQNFDSLKENLAYAGYLNKDEKNSVEDKRAALKAMMNTYPPLPDTKFVDIDASDCHPPKDYSTNNGLYQLKELCFREWTNKSGQTISGKAAASRLVLWSILMPELSQAVSQVGSSNGGGSILTVPVGQGARPAG